MEIHPPNRDQHPAHSGQWPKTGNYVGVYAGNPPFVRGWSFSSELPPTPIPQRVGGPVLPPQSTPVLPGTLCWHIPPLLSLRVYHDLRSFGVCSSVYHYSMECSATRCRTKESSLYPFELWTNHPLAGSSEYAIFNMCDHQPMFLNGQQGPLVGSGSISEMPSWPTYPLPELSNPGCRPWLLLLPHQCRNYICPTSQAELLSPPTEKMHVAAAAHIITAL